MHDINIEIPKTLDARLIPIIMQECSDHNLDFGKVIQDVVKPDIPITVKVALYGDETGWPEEQIEAARNVYRVENASALG